MSAHFFNELDASISHKLEGGDYIRTVTLNEALVFYTDSGDEIAVPAGFESDGASVPKAFWSRFPPFGKYLAAAVVHDLLCVQGHKGECVYDSVEAADIFRQAMLVCGVGKFRSWKMHFAVRWFGPRWHKKASPEGLAEEL